jgi:hypothetical protein
MHSSSGQERNAHVFLRTFKPSMIGHRGRLTRDIAHHCMHAPKLTAQQSRAAEGSAGSKSATGSLACRVSQILTQPAVHSCRYRRGMGPGSRVAAADSQLLSCNTCGHHHHMQPSSLSRTITSTCDYLRGTILVQAPRPVNAVDDACMPFCFVYGLV